MRERLPGLDFSDDDGSPTLLSSWSWHKLAHHKLVRVLRRHSSDGWSPIISVEYYDYYENMATEMATKKRLRRASPDLGPWRIGSLSLPSPHCETRRCRASMWDQLWDLDGVSKEGCRNMPIIPGHSVCWTPPQNANVQFELMKVSTLTFYKCVKNFESRVFFISAPGRRALKRWCLKGRSSSHFRADHRKPLQIMPRKFARHTSEGYTWSN